MAKLRSTREIVIWSEVLPVIERKIEAALAEAEGATDLRLMGRAQGRLAALREVRDLPKLLLTASELDEAAENDREAIRRSQDPANWQHPDLMKGR